MLQQTVERNAAQENVEDLADVNSEDSGGKLQTETGSNPDDHVEVVEEVLSV